MKKVKNSNRLDIERLKGSFYVFLKYHKRRSRVHSAHFFCWQNKVFTLNELKRYLKQGKILRVSQLWIWKPRKLKVSVPMPFIIILKMSNNSKKYLKESLPQSKKQQFFCSKLRPMVHKLINFFRSDSFDVLLGRRVPNLIVLLAERKKILEVCYEPQHEYSVSVASQSPKIQIDRQKSQQLQLNISFNSTQASLNLSQVASTFYSDYLATIDQQRLMETRCLGCSTFFLQNFNILDRTINRVPLEVFPSVWSMKEYENQIKNVICYLMNSKGGVILFDCLVQSGVVLANGTKLSEKNKQLFEQRLYSYLEVFEPSEEVKKSVTVTYVPVVDSSQGKNELTKKGRSFYLGEESFTRPGQSYFRREFIPGHFVMRVRVCPKSNTSVCFWRQSNNFDLEEKYNDYVCTLNRNGVMTTIKPSEIGKEIKKRMKEHYLPENLTSKQLRLLSHPSNYFDHECVQPQINHCSIQQSSDQRINVAQQYSNLKVQIIEYKRQQQNSNNQDNVLFTVQSQDISQNGSEYLIQNIMFVVQKVKDYQIQDLPFDL